MRRLRGIGNTKSLLDLRGKLKAELALARAGDLAKKYPEELTLSNFVKEFESNEEKGYLVLAYYEEKNKDPSLQRDIITFLGSKSLPIWHLNKIQPLNYENLLLLHNYCNEINSNERHIKYDYNNLERKDLVPLIVQDLSIPHYLSDEKYKDIHWLHLAAKNQGKNKDSKWSDVAYKENYQIKDIIEIVKKEEELIQELFYVTPEELMEIKEAIGNPSYFHELVSIDFFERSNDLMKECFDKVFGNFHKEYTSEDYFNHIMSDYLALKRKERFLDAIGDEEHNE